MQYTPTSRLNNNEEPDDLFATQESLGEFQIILNTFVQHSKFRILERAPVNILDKDFCKKITLSDGIYYSNGQVTVSSNDNKFKTRDMCIDPSIFRRGIYFLLLRFKRFNSGEITIYDSDHIRTTLAPSDNMTNVIILTKLSSPTQGTKIEFTDIDPNNTVSFNMYMIRFSHALLDELKSI